MGPYGMTESVKSYMTLQCPVDGSGDSFVEIDPGTPAAIGVCHRRPSDIRGGGWTNSAQASSWHRYVKVSSAPCSPAPATGRERVGKPG